MLFILPEKSKDQFCQSPLGVVVLVLVLFFFLPILLIVTSIGLMALLLHI